MDPFSLAFGAVAIVAFVVKGKVDSTAYANGMEPPGVAKARMRHERGGGLRAASGRPKGPGAFRLMVASRWANACLAAKQRADHKAARRRAWFEEIAPQKDAQWREKQIRRLEKADAGRRKWAQSRGLIDLSEYRERRAEDQAWAENARRNAGAATVATDPPADERPLRERVKEALADDTTGQPGDTVRRERSEGGPDSDGRGSRNDGHDEPTPDPAAQADDKPGEPQPEEPSSTAGPQDSSTESGPVADPESDEPTKTVQPTDGVATGTPGGPVQNTGTEGSSTVYEQAVTRLIQQANQAAEYRDNLRVFADTLEGKGWGVEVTGPAKDLYPRLQKLEGIYRDQATQMQSQGDQGRDAYDQAPWVPGPDAVLA